jgi:hypothetical protein
MALGEYSQYGGMQAFGDNLHALGGSIYQLMLQKKIGNIYKNNVEIDTDKAQAAIDAMPVTEQEYMAATKELMSRSQARPVDSYQIGGPGIPKQKLGGLGEPRNYQELTINTVSGSSQPPSNLPPMQGPRQNPYSTAGLGLGDIGIRPQPPTRESIYDYIRQRRSDPRFVEQFARKNNMIKVNRDKLINELSALGPQGLEIAFKQQQIWDSKDEAGKVDASKLPSNVAEWNYYQTLSPEDKQSYLEMKRAEKTFMTDVGGVPTIIKGKPLGKPSSKEPLSTYEEEQAAQKNSVEQKNKEAELEVKRAELGMKKEEAGRKETEFEKGIIAENRKTKDAISVFDRMSGKAMKLYKNKNLWQGTGLAGEVLGRIPGITGYDVKAKLTSLKSQLGLMELQRMKQNSPTGSAGMGALSDAEGDRLEQMISSLDTRQSPAALRESLLEIYEQMDAYKRALREDMDSRQEINEPVISKPTSTKTTPKAGKGRQASPEDFE